MENLFVFLIAFIIIFIVLLANYFVKKRHKELKNSKEISFLVGRFKLNKKDLNYNSLGLVFVLVNSFIIALTGTIASNLHLHYIWQLAVGFALLMSLIYTIYSLIGQYLIRKEVKNGKYRKN